MRRRSTRRPAQQRGDLPLPAVGARIRHQQSAGLLEHVPRGLRPRPPAALGTGKGTCDIRDWDAADLLIILGVNAASNAPRMLTTLAKAQRRGAQIIHVNPLIEAAARRTIVPHEFAAMATHHATSTGTMTSRCASAATSPCCAGSRRRSSSGPAGSGGARRRIPRAAHVRVRVLPRPGRATEWSELVRQSGVEEQIRGVAERYMAAGRTVAPGASGSPSRTTGSTASARS